MRLVLASGSPRRAELLAAAGFEFDVLEVHADERVRAGESPPDYVCRLASEKSARARERLLAGTAPPGPQDPAYASQSGPEAPFQAARGTANESTANVRPQEPLIVLGADTAVVIDREILGKPSDDADARAMLRRLSGRLHQVVTGVSLRSAGHEAVASETTTVWVSRLTGDDIEWYVGTGEGRDKAGAYAIQGRACRFIPRIEGSYTNVVGLPVALVHAMLARMSLGLPPVPGRVASAG